MCKMLAEHGHQVSVLDDLSTGHLEAVRWGKLHRGDLVDAARVSEVFREVRPEAVMHFAAKAVVPESVVHPELYYRTNVIGTLNVLDQVRQIPGCLFVFSSTCAIFGSAQTPKIGETHPINPINSYGRSKRMVEVVLADYWPAYRLPSVSLRYFNAAGADPAGEIGESHTPETHLIPNVLEAAAGRKPQLRVYGNDYPTHDGTCVRDYVHINDLCRAHMLGLQLMQRDPGCHAFNLGSGSGFSVQQVLEAASNVIGRKMEFELAERRPGDPASLVADSALAHKVLDWEPAFTLDAIIESAWRWHQARKF